MLLSTAKSLSTARSVRFPSGVWQRIPTPDRSDDCVIAFDPCVDPNCASKFVRLLVEADRQDLQVSVMHDVPKEFASLPLKVVHTCLASK